jgi:hypothetical protein
MVAQWSVKKEISLGDIVSIVAALVAVIFAYSTLDKRLAVIEEQYVTQRRIDGRQDEDLAQMKRDIRDDLQAIRTLVERLAYRSALVKP